MKTPLPLIMIILLTGISQSRAAITPPDPLDYVLVAYKLTAAQESTFSASDTTASPFWQVLTNNPGDIDYLQLTPTLNARIGSVFGFEEDAQLEVYAAWGEKGLYLYFNVLDDNWPDTPWWYDSETKDAITFFLDDKSSSYMAANPSVWYALRWTKTMVQYQITIPGSEVPTTFRFNQLDPAWNTNSTDFSTSIKYSSLTMAEGEAEGIHIKTCDSGNDITRVQAWLIPWRHISYHGIAVPAVGDTIGAVFGYNDVDGDMTEGVNQLRWKTSDPYSLDDCWADIEFGPLIADAIGIPSEPATRLATPLLTVPAKAETNVAVPTTLAWNPVDSATAYIVQVSTSPTFNACIINDSNVTVSSYNASNLSYLTKYFWRIRAICEPLQKYSYWSATFSFTTMTNQPIAVKPANTAAQPFSINETSHLVMYTLPRRCKVSLKYYDLTGRLIATAVDQIQDAGYHSAMMPDRNVAHGSYLRIFKADNIIQKDIVPAIE